MPTLALSTGEAELGALVKGAAEAEGLRAFLLDFGVNADICIKSDAAAAVGISKRLGLGRVRHLAVSDLWIQQRIRQGGMVVQKLPGLVNPADALTKAIDGSRVRALAQAMGIRRECDDYLNTEDLEDASAQVVPSG